MLGTVENKISVAPLQILPRFKKAKNCVLGFPRGGVLGIPRTYWQSTLGPWFSKESLDFQWDMSPWIFQDVSCDRSLDFQGVSCDRTLDFQGLCWAWSPWISKDMRIGLGVLDNGPWVIDTSMTAGPLLVQGGGGGTGGASWWWWGSTGWKRGGGCMGCSWRDSWSSSNSQACPCMNSLGMLPLCNVSLVWKYKWWTWQTSKVYFFPSTCTGIKLSLIILLFYFSFRSSGIGKPK